MVFPARAGKRKFRKLLGLLLLRKNRGSRKKRGRKRKRKEEKEKGRRERKKGRRREQPPQGVTGPPERAAVAASEGGPYRSYKVIGEPYATPRAALSHRVPAPPPSYPSPHFPRPAPLWPPAACQRACPLPVRRFWLRCDAHRRRAHTPWNCAVVTCKECCGVPPNPSHGPSWPLGVWLASGGTRIMVPSPPSTVVAASRRHPGVREYERAVGPWELL